MSTNANALKLQIEGVDKKLPEALERCNVIWSKIKKADDAKPVSSKSYRVPLYLLTGSRFKYVNRGGGAMGLGSAGKIDEQTLSTVAVAQALQIHDDADFFTNSPTKAIRSYFALELEKSTQEAASQIDRQVNAGINGQLATVTGTGGVTITCNNNRGVQLLRVGQKVGVTNAGISTGRGECTIVAVNRVAKTFDVDAIPGGTVATDLIFAEGLYPTAGGVSAQSVIFSLAYQRQTSGTVFGLSRTTYSELQPSVVDAASTNISINYVRQLYAKLARKRVAVTDIWADKSTFFHGEAAQEMGWASVGDPITEIQLSGGDSRDPVDFVGRARTKIMGIPLVVSPNADPGVLDFLQADNFGRIEAEPFGFKKDKNGDQFFTPMSTTDGSPLASTLAYLTTVMQLFVYDGGVHGGIINLNVNY